MQFKTGLKPKFIYLLHRELQKLVGVWHEKRLIQAQSLFVAATL